MVASSRLSDSACCCISTSRYTSTHIDRINYAGPVGFEEDVELLGVLVEPQRRRIYDELVQAAEPQTLSDLAARLDLGRTLMAFHINKLVSAGLVEVLPAQAREGRRGRPSQRYRASRREIEASVPPRRYDIVASVLLDAARTQQP